MPRPIEELKGCLRIALNPNEERTLIFHLPVDQLSFYSDDIRLNSEFEIEGKKKTSVKERVFFCPIFVQ
jgi:hypothetical protein